jgi:hypothetical protein
VLVSEYVEKSEKQGLVINRNRGAGLAEARFGEAGERTKMYISALERV